MQEIEVKNDFDAKILINGVPDHRLIIADKESGFLEALELQISEHFKEQKLRVNGKPSSLPARLSEFSAIIFPLDGDRFSDTTQRRKTIS